MQHARKSRLSLACTLACSSLYLAIPGAHAQGDGGASVLTLEEVIVTAQRKEQSANDVGMDIQSYSGANLEQLRVTDVEDLTKVVPAFTVFNRPNRGPPTK